jgi:hypothetical protein
VVQCAISWWGCSGRLIRPMVISTLPYSNSTIRSSCRCLLPSVSERT